MGTDDDRVTPLLQVEGLTLTYGSVEALSAVDFAMQRGELLAIVGPNGAGKTSLFNCLNGLEVPQSGSIRLAGRDLVGQPPDAIARAGVARMFQNLALFGKTSVLANVMAGRHHLMPTGWFSGFAYWGRARRDEIEHRERVEEILDFLEIDHLRWETVGSLPYGLQKRVELARALAMDPQLLLLDEPAAGMNLEETEDMARFILDVLEDRGVTILLVEHDMGMVMDIAHRVLVLDSGRRIAHGSPSEVQDDPDVITAYLGQQDWALADGE